jgi:hypothetical protein
VGAAPLAGEIQHRWHRGGGVLRVHPHTDVETLTDETGDTTATYGYTAFGRNDTAEFTGVDKPEAQEPGEEPYNVYFDCEVTGRHGKLQRRKLTDAVPPPVLVEGTAAMKWGRKQKGSWILATIRRGRPVSPPDRLSHVRAHG